MSRSVVETVIGAIVLIGAFVFLVFSYSKGDAGKVSGYNIYANFSGIGGLKVGDAVEVSGVKIGQVAEIALDPKTYLAKVTMEIDDNVKLPKDTAAMISSQSLLGGRFMSLEPGGEEDTIPTDGKGKIDYTQAPQNIEELLGKFIFSMKDGKDKTKGEGNASESATNPAPVSATAPAPASSENP